MKKQFTAGTMLIVVLALLLSAVAGSFSLYLRQLDSARQTLREALELLDAQAETTDPDHTLAVFRAAAPDKRLTVIAPNGAVLGDTGGDPLDNHATRPEVAQALSAGWGEITRSSATVGCPMLYVAKRFSDGLIVRASMPLSSVDALVWEGLPPLFLAALLALLLAWSLSRRLARRLVKPLTVVDEHLREILDGGEPTALAQYDSDPELRPVLRSIRQLTDRLADNLSQFKAERDKVNLILDCMDEGFLLLDEEGKLLAVNQAARDLFGLPRNAWEGAQVLLRSGPLRKAVQAARERQVPAVLDLRDPALGERELRFFLTPVSGRRFEGKNVGVSILVSDVTELKKAENIRSEFTANVSHELKTPLTSIKGFSEMLSQGMVKEPEEQKRFLTLISVEVDRLISLINDILEISELESARIDTPAETASPLDTAREVEKLLLSQAEAKGAAIWVEGDPGLARISPHRLKELLLNLMENAVRYGREGGGVEVKVARQGPNMVLSVRDDGIGIPPEAQAHLFERFYRVDKGRSRQSGGTGLGLAIVKHIVELYGGSVAVDSAPGRGSAFTVTLPAAE